MTRDPFTLDFEKPLRDLRQQLESLKATSQEHDFDVSEEVRAIERRMEETKKRVYSGLSSWQRVQLARHPARPYALDYIRRIFRDFEELHGDRAYGDDQALIGGTAWFGDTPVMILAQQKGRDTKENLLRNFGMPHPEGYRKAYRLMRLAEKFSMPLICFIDTKAAYAGVGSEERHVSEAIARNLFEMSRLRTPIIGAILGEGGSGGALGIGVVDRLLVQAYAYYSVIPPEGCAAILWRDRKYTEQAAEALRLGASELIKQGVADELIEEPLGGAHHDADFAAGKLREALARHLDDLRGRAITSVVNARYEKYRRMGEFEEARASEAQRAVRAS